MGKLLDIIAKLTHSDSIKVQPPSNQDERARAKKQLDRAQELQQRAESLGIAVEGMQRIEKGKGSKKP